MVVSCDDSDSEPTISNSADGVVINGVTWATCNVAAPGTFATNPEDAGMFYQWDSNTGWFATNVGTDDEFINYVLSSNGDTAWVDVLPSGSVSAWDDTYNETHISLDTITGDTVQWNTANNICPTGWRMPTKDELQSLINSGYKWTTVNGVEGCIFGSGSNAIFLPAIGYRSSFDGSLLNEVNGYYWAKDQIGGTNNHLFLQDGGLTLGNVQLKLGNALSVRCVKE